MANIDLAAALAAEWQLGATLTVWQPNAGRTLAVVPRSPSTSRTGTTTPVPLRWPDKAPGAVLDISLDLSAMVHTGDSGTRLSGLVTPARTGDLVILSASIAGTTGTFWVAGGVEGQDYQVSWQAAMKSGRVLTGNAYILARSTSTLAPASSAPPANPNPAVPGQSLLGNPLGTTAAAQPVLLGIGLEIDGGVLRASPGQAGPAGPQGPAGPAGPGTTVPPAQLLAGVNGALVPVPDVGVALAKANSGTVARPVADRWVTINPEDLGAVPVKALFSLCATTPGSNIVVDALGRFTQDLVGLPVDIGDAATGYTCLSSTVTAVSQDGTQLTLAPGDNAAVAVPYNGALLQNSQFTPAPGTTGWAVGDHFKVLPANGTTTLKDVDALAATTQVLNATINNPGSGGTPGTYTFATTTGQPSPVGKGAVVDNRALFSVVVGSDGTAKSITVSAGGLFIEGPNNNAGSVPAEPLVDVAGTSGLTGLAAALDMAPGDIQTNDPGAFSVPFSLAGTYTGVATTGSGTSLTLKVTPQRYGGTVTIGKDSGPAYVGAARAAQAVAATGRPVILQWDPDTYLLRDLQHDHLDNAVTVPVFSGPVTVRGSGKMMTRIYISGAHNLTGPMISFADCTLQVGTAAVPIGANQFNLAAPAGCGVEDLTFAGDRGGALAPDIVVTYGHTSHCHIENLDFWYVRGWCVAINPNRGTTVAGQSTTESRVRNIRCWECGDTGTARAPVFWSCLQGGSDDWDWENVRVFAPHYIGLDIYANGGAVLVNHMRSISVEACVARYVPYPLMRFFGSGNTNVNQIAIDGLDLINARYGTCALLFDGDGPANQHNNIAIKHGRITGGSTFGDGIHINRLRSSTLEFDVITANGWDVVVGPSSGVNASAILLEGSAASDVQWSVKLDPSNSKGLQIPVLATGVPGDATLPASPLIFPSTAGDTALVLGTAGQVSGLTTGGVLADGTVAYTRLQNVGVKTGPLNQHGTVTDLPAGLHVLMATNAGSIVGAVLNLTPGPLDGQMSGLITPLPITDLTFATRDTGVTVVGWPAHQNAPVGAYLFQFSAFANAWLPLFPTAPIGASATPTPTVSVLGQGKVTSTAIAKTNVASAKIPKTTMPIDGAIRITGQAVFPAGGSTNAKIVYVDLALSGTSTTGTNFLTLSEATSAIATAPFQFEIRADGATNAQIGLGTADAGFANAAAQPPKATLDTVANDIYVAFGLASAAGEEVDLYYTVELLAPAS